MEMRKALRPLRRRMVLEAAIRAVVSAGLIVLPVGIAGGVVLRAMRENALLWACVPGGWALLALLFYGLRDRPTLKQVARRVDEMTGGDRVGTMVEFAHSDATLCRLQRADTLERLGGVNPSALPVRICVPALVVCMALLAGAAVVALLPDRAFAGLPFAAKQESEESRMLYEKVEQMRQNVENSALSDDQKAELLDRLAQMEAQIASGEMDISMLTEIARQMETWSTAEDQLPPLTAYAQALLEQESLRPLGEAILTQDMEAVRKALCDMGENLTALTGNDQVNALMGIVYDIGDTLRRPVADEGQAKLTHTMVVLSGDLESVAAMKYGRQDTAAAISDALKKAENGIAAFLDGDQAYEESEKEELRPENRSKFTESQSADAVKLPSETQYVYDPPQAARTDGYVPGETDASGNPQRILAPQDESLDGTVPYGQVLSRYYAAYLEELDTLPQALLEEMETYFDGL